jgi:tRNA pseudouridine55 synthase
MKTAPNGIVLIDKEAGITSHDVVRRVRGVFGKGRRFKVGHAGTLDPFATGLLIVLLGQATRLSNYIMSGEKVYDAVMRLGIETDTLDATGQTVSTQPVPDFSDAQIREKAAGFLGDLAQTPPAYSAVKVGGRRAYELAREGVDVHLRKRRVTVSVLDIVWVQLPRVALRIRCSAGTYIRSLAADLGKALGPGAHLITLRRIKSGRFHVKDALNSQKLSQGVRDLLGQRTLALRDAIPDIREIEVDQGLARKIRQGYQPEMNELTNSHGHSTERRIGVGWGGKGFIKLVSQGNLVAVLTVTHGGGDRHDRVAIDKVFSD